MTKKKFSYIELTGNQSWETSDESDCPFFAIRKEHGIARIIRFEINLNRIEIFDDVVRYGTTHIYCFFVTLWRSFLFLLILGNVHDWNVGRDWSGRGWWGLKVDSCMVNSVENSIADVKIMNGRSVSWHIGLWAQATSAEDGGSGKKRGKSRAKVQTSENNFILCQLGNAFIVDVIAIR